MIFDKAEILIVGAGIIGLTIARELVKSGRDGIVIIEKEPEPGRHASGRNSGVLHAGIYYSPDSLKAKSCLNGNFLSEIPVSMEGGMKPREMHGRLGQGGAPIRLRTVNGAIRVVALRSTV